MFHAFGPQLRVTLSKRLVISLRPCRSPIGPASDVSVYDPHQCRGKRGFEISLGVHEVLALFLSVPGGVVCVCLPESGKQKAESRYVSFCSLFSFRGRSKPIMGFLCSAAAAVHPTRLSYQLILLPPSNYLTTNRVLSISTSLSSL
jgi:hypothetical protein